MAGAVGKSDATHDEKTFETEAMCELEGRAAHIRGHESKSLYLFLKNVVLSGAIEKAASMPEWHLVTVEDLYR